MSFTPTHLRQEASLSFSLFPSNLRFLRKRRGLNQEDISALFNKKANTVGNWENGKTEPSIPELLVISGYFGVNLEELLRSEMRQQQLDSERQLSLWPGTVERIAAVISPAAISESGRPAGSPLQPAASSGPTPTPALTPTSNLTQPAAALMVDETGTYNNDRYNNESTRVQAERQAWPVSRLAEAPATPTDTVLPGDAMWFMLRELRSVQERLDRLQFAFDQSRTYKPADKSDH